MDENDEKLCEYRDPDYSSPTKRFDDSSSGDREVEKLKAIIKKELQNEIQSKERTLATVDERLLLARKTFHKLRYAVVNNFYNSKKFELNNDDVQRELSCTRDPKGKSEVLSLLCDEQKRLHPAVKKAAKEKLDDVPIDISPLRPMRKRFKPDPDSLASTVNNLTIPVDANYESLRPNIKTEIGINCKNDQYGEIAKAYNVESGSNNTMKIPMYVGPKDADIGVLEIDPVIRNKQKKKFRIIIGNTSKYIMPTSKDDFITHRWLLYVRGPKLTPDISHIVDSITVQLHDSYAPQNIIKLKSSPFHLSKRGWGEFPVKLRLHFKNQVFNKPVNIIHNLKLDRYHTGIQTLGGETVVDVWLYTDETMIDINKDIGMDDNNSNADNEIDNNAPLINLQLVKSEPLDIYYEDLQSTKTEEDGDCVYIKEEPMEIDENVEDDGVFSEDLTTLNVYNLDNGYDHKLNNRELHVYNDHSYFIHTSNFTNSEDHCDELEKVIFAHIQSLVSLSYFSELYERFGINTIVDNINFDIEKFVELNKSLVEKLFESDSKYIDRDVIVENVTCVNAYLIKQYTKSTISLFQSGFTRDIERVSKYVYILKNVISINDAVSLEEETSDNIFLTGKKVLNIICAVWSGLIKIKDMRCAINVMLKNMPLIDRSAKASVYNKIFPYVVASAEEFFHLDIVKRRNLIWTRAKLINNFLRNFFDNSYVWSTKQIIIFGQYHGYFPIRIAANSRVKIDINRFISIEDKVAIKESFDSVYEINSKTLFNIVNEESTKVKIEKIDDRYDNSLENENCYYISDSSDDEIDICDNLNQSKSLTKKHHTVNKISNSKMLPFRDNNEMLQCQYIEKELDHLGLKIRSHNIGNGYVCSLIHKMMLAVCKSFAEDLIRRSLCVKIEAVNSNESVGMKYLKCLNEGNKIQSPVKQEVESDCKLSNNFKIEPGKEDDDSKTPLPITKIWNISENGHKNEISIRHIFEALKTRKEFDFLTNCGIGIEGVNYNGDL